MASTRDGFMWTPSEGLLDGLPTIGAVDPPSYSAPESKGDHYDVIVIGAGYAGLVATRDLTTQGRYSLALTFPGRPFS